MIRRCCVPENKDYPKYGGRGICVCKRWFRSFKAFLADMGSKPSKQHSIDRIDSRGNYEPSNCRWATSKQQGINRRNIVNLTFNGKTQTQLAWSIELKIPNSVIHYRLSIGMSVEEALSKPRRRAYLTARGRTQRMSDWSRETGVAQHVISKRIKRGWSDEQALGLAPPPLR
jgi:hypothetical protein